MWQIMHRCADAMPEVFRYEDVRDWFSSNYPDVNEATIRAHLIGLTEGGRAKHVQFAQRSPVFRRVARGEYSPIPLDERGEDPDPDQPPPSASRIKMSGNGAHKTSPGDRPSEVGGQRPVRTADGPPGEESGGAQTMAVPDVILLGSVGERVNVPAPAKEIYRDVAFQRSRLDAETSGTEWFLLSAEHGLVAPHEWISPDSRTLADLDPEYRVVWARWVVARLESMLGCLDGTYVRVEAPNAFVGPLFADLQDAGAVVSSGDVGLAISVSTAAPDAESVDPPDAEPAEAPDLAPVVQISPVASVAHELADASQAVPASDLSGLPETPGLYGWIVDPVGARELNRCLRLPVRAGLIFVGQVGGSGRLPAAEPVTTLREHIDRVQLHGLARASTFRMNLATVLRGHLRMATLDDEVMTDWMLEHLSVSSWVGEDRAELRDLERQVIRELEPPLNVDRVPFTEYRTRLGQMRSGIA
ncbi:hypothetical protein C3E78_10820 [Aeromicrobium chenweiae]|uniref:Uncharacterized protein n=1 Tax=Aeromicrobium chenweiae TaxID=2079793 RepID=A0A2S0WMS5_9ACTN|nr:hypothetical protein C3E78_10820 [Aeromicrobium chenweiae]